VTDRLKIGILGATGPLGRGLAARLALAGHTVLVGSRSRERATDAVDGLLERTGPDVLFEPVVNEEAVENADMIVVAMPYEGQADTLRALSPAPGTIVVNVVNPLGFDDEGPHVIAVEAGSAAEECQEIWAESRVVAAFKETPARMLLDVATPMDCDVFIAGDDEDAVDRVIGIVDEIPDARGIACGRLRSARYLETLTPLLIGVNRRYKAHAGIRLVGVTK
jgi:8-hydroxy-5-deazaflavin:NADPH oxidoreductase